MNFATKGEGALRRVLEDARERSRCTREALTVLQVDPYRLDTPANHRDGAWVDALATLRPRDLETIVEAAIESYFDSSLGSRVRLAKRDWEEQAQEALEEQIDSVALDAIRERAAERLLEIRTELESINSQLRMAVDEIVELPEAIVPAPAVDEKLSRPLISSSWSWVMATRALKARKAYGDES
jgi:hypothetical protein